jgi:nucleoside-diphosphate-sugar epimerase
MSERVSRALVTGGAGFIGSHIVDELMRRGIETLVIDDFSSGSMQNLERYAGNPLLRVFKGDVSHVGELLSEVEDIDVVFHEAAIASVPKSVEDPLLVNRVNVDKSLELMNYCVERHVRRFVFASSAAVYGVLGDRPASEDMLCLPVSPYGSSKLAVECYLASFYKTYGLETVGLRYFNVYGPRQRANDYSGVITVFTNNLIRGKAPTIFGDGMQTRDFVFVQDIARANMLAMEAQAAVGECFNVASGTSTTILNLLDILKGATGVEAECRFMPQRMGDVKSGEASIAKIERVLGYRPRTSLEDGLAQLVESIKAQATAGALSV